ncbi:614_t:CDS:2, partial [Gigaspora margarita]
MDVEQETEVANTVSEGETLLKGFIWKYYKTDQVEGFYYCDVEVPV